MALPGPRLHTSVRRLSKSVPCLRQDSRRSSSISRSVIGRLSNATSYSENTTRGEAMPIGRPESGAKIALDRHAGGRETHKILLVNAYLI